MDEIPKLELSGPAWCERWPTDRTTAGLVQPFRSAVQRFITALEAAGCTVRISATRRPSERAYLMRGAWDIVHGLTRPELVPAREGVPIQWVHPTHEASVEAARQMVERYELAHRPSLNSRHIDGRAIDMRIEIPRRVTVRSATGALVELRPGATTELWSLGATYGVIKLPSDPPHWSDDGR